MIKDDEVIRRNDVVPSYSLLAGSQQTSAKIEFVVFDQILSTDLRNVSVFLANPYLRSLWLGSSEEKKKPGSSRAYFLWDLAPRNARNGNAVLTRLRFPSRAALFPWRCHGPGEINNCFFFFCLPSLQFYG